MKNEDPGIKKHSNRESAVKTKDNPFPFLLQYPVKINVESVTIPEIEEKPIYINRVYKY